MKRFLAQHHDLSVGRSGSNWVNQYDTLAEAQSAADVAWSPDQLAIRQEITDAETGERWFRADGASDWRHANAPRDGGLNEAAARIVREATGD